VTLHLQNTLWILFGDYFLILSHGLLIPDALIATTAIITETSLSSKNQKDYRFIKNLELLPSPNPLG
jgi:predicted nucleic acid-binding protein